MIWLDGLDVPLVNHLGATFSDDYDEATFPQSRPPHDSLSRYGSGMLPLEPVTHRYSPVFSYPYERTRTALENMRKANDWDACHGLKLKFANPATGDWVMPTIATFAQLLPKGFHTAPYRSTEATVVMVAEGSGKATVGDQTYTLRQARHICGAELDLVGGGGAGRSRPAQLFRPRGAGEARSLARAARQRAAAPVIPSVLHEHALRDREEKTMAKEKFNREPSRIATSARSDTSITARRR